MRKYRLSRPATILGAFLLAPLLAAFAVGGEARFEALCVGLRYPGTGMELNYTTNDVKAVSSALRGLSGFAERNCQVERLVDDEPDGAKPTAREIRSRLAAMAASAREGDRLVFYFSGHGLLVDGQAVLVCHGGRDMRDGSAHLYLSELKGILAGSRAESKLVIVDACHSGGKSGGGGLMTPDGVASAMASSGKAAGEDTVAWLVSCDASEQSWEDDDKRQGLFTRYFLEAVGDMAEVADTNYDGQLSVAEIHKYVTTGIGHYIYERSTVKRDRLWHSRRQTPSMGVGRRVMPGSEEMDRFRMFYYQPTDDSTEPQPSEYLGRHNETHGISWQNEKPDIQTIEASMQECLDEITIHIKRQKYNQAIESAGIAETVYQNNPHAHQSETAKKRYEEIVVYKGMASRLQMQEIIQGEFKQMRLRVDRIVWSPETAKALINGKWYSSGDRIDESARIEMVEENAVIVQFKGMRFKIPVEMTVPNARFPPESEDDSTNELTVLKNTVSGYDKHPPIAKAELERAIALDKSGRYVEAAEVYKAILYKYPNYPVGDAVWLRVGEILYRHGEYEDALAAYQKASTAATIRNSSLGDKIQYKMAWSIQRLAEAAEKQSLEDNDRQQREAARKMMWDRRLAAISAFETIVGRFPNSSLIGDACFRAAELRRRCGQDNSDSVKRYAWFETSSQRYRQAVEWSRPDVPYYAAAQYGNGLVLLLNGHSTVARDAFRKLLRDSDGPFVQDAYWGLGQANLNLGALGDATSAFEQALALDKTTETAVKSQFGLGLTTEMAGNNVKAIEVYLAVNTIYHDYPEWAAAALVRAARAALAEGMRERALEFLQEVRVKYSKMPAAEEATQLLDAIMALKEEGVLSNATDLGPVRVGEARAREFQGAIRFVAAPYQ